MMSDPFGILLAAGESSRLGQPKQLLDWKGVPLIVHALSEMRTVCAEVRVVLGAHAGEIQKVLPSEIRILFNEEWQSGLGSSIRKGMNEALTQKTEDWVLLNLCDQPYLDRRHFARLIASQDESGVVATAYGQRAGVPALFHRKHWNTLVKFQGDAGARYILNQPNTSIPMVKPTESTVDIDTLEDYHKLTGNSDPP